MEQLSNLTSWLANNATGVETGIFYVVSALAIPFAFGVIFDRAIIRSGFLLIGMFGMVSLMFLLLQAQFLAMAQIMIYAVGITLVVVIALMLTNPKLETDLSPTVSKHSVGAFFFSLLLFMTIYMSVRSEHFVTEAQSVADTNNVTVIGTLLTTDYALPFEFASVLLLAALVGAIMLAKAEPAEQLAEYSIEGEKDSSESEALTTVR